MYTVIKSFVSLAKFYPLVTVFGGGAVNTPVSTTMAAGTSVMTAKNKTTSTTLPVIDGATSNITSSMSSVGAKAVHCLQGRNNINTKGGLILL